MSMLDRVRDGARDLRNRWTYRDGGRRLARPRLPKFEGRWPRRIALVLAAFLLVYYPLGMLWTHKVDDDVSFAPQGEMLPGQSRAVAIAAELVDREVNTNGWVANNPFFMPSSLLDNMPNFQKGILAAMARFSFELTDQLGRTRGSSEADSDLQ